MIEEGDIKSKQKVLVQVRPPRVQITYDVEVDNKLEKRELPFVMAVISNLYGDQEDKVPYDEQRFINLNRDNFDSVIKAIRPMIKLRLSSSTILDKERGRNCELLFTSINSFSPDEIVLQVPEYKTLVQERKLLTDLLPKIDGNSALHKKLLEVAKLDTGIDKQQAEDIVSTTGFVKLDDSLDVKKYRTEMVLAFDKHAKSKKDAHLHSIIMHSIINIDTLLSKEMDEILHDPSFQALEAKWRSIYNLVMKTETGTNLKISLLSVSSEDLYNDLSYASEFDQSRLFQWIYEEEYGTMGGTPYSCVVLDEYFGKSEYDTRFLSLLSQVGSAAHAPFLVGVKPEMFEIQTFNDLHIPRDLTAIFESSDSIHWCSFRKQEDSRYVNLFMPQVLIRTPYSPETIPTRSFNYTEQVDGQKNDKFCWGNAAFAMAVQINLAVAKYGWAAAIRGSEGGGLVEGLPSYTFRTQFADIAVKCPTQTHITDRRERELSNLGFIALCHKKMTDQAVFFSSQSAQKPVEYEDPVSSANAKISARMPYVLNASRFAHYLKVIMRDKVGSFQSAEQIEYYLQEWIAAYVLLSDDASQDTKAEYPLREAEIKVTEVAGDPGQYEIVMRLRPHFQMESVTVSMRFVARVKAD